MSLIHAVRDTFRAIATTVVPETAALDDEGWAELEAIIERALAERPPAMRRQLVVFIRALDLLPVARWGRTFRRLDSARRAQFLAGVERARPFVVRRGFWGLRTLILMGYYARPAAYAEVGYGARLRGWLEHPEATAAARDAAAGAQVTGGAGPTGGQAPGGRQAPGGGGAP